MPLPAKDGIREALLRELIVAQADLCVHAGGRGDKPGFIVLVRYGGVERVLTGSRSAPRVFATLDAVGRCVRDLGLMHFEVDLSEHKPGLVRPPRMDRATAMRMANPRHIGTTKNTKKK